MTIKVLSLLAIAAVLEIVVASNRCRLTTPCAVSYTTVGCFKDSVSDRVLTHYIYQERDKTRKDNYGNRDIEWYNWNNYIVEFSCRCAARAKALGYDLFGIQFYGECWAGNSGTHNHARLGKSPKCLSDSYGECSSSDRYCAGKHETNFVYKIIDTSCSLNFERVGCYKDKHNSGARPLANYVLNDRDSSDASYSGQNINWVSYDAYLPDFACRCAKKALAEGGKYFGLQFYGECWTHPDGKNTFARDGVSSGCIDNCYQKCGGDKGEICTGEHHENYVYRIKEADEPVCDISYESVGCYVENPDDRALRTELTNSNPGSVNFYGRMRVVGKWNEFFPEFACQCARLAKNKGWQYFGVNEYGDCYSDIVSENYNKHGSSGSCREGDADSSCSAGSKMCSGPDSLSNYVYKINVTSSGGGKKRSFIPAKFPFRDLA